MKRKSVIMENISVIFIIAIIGLLSCANPYHRNYKSMLDRWPHVKMQLSDISEAPVPRLFTSKDLKIDSMNLLEDGYILIGKSAFKSPPINEEQAIKQAKEVGADIVLTKKEYVGTKTESIPITEYLPDKRSTTRAHSTFQTSPTAQPSIAITEVTQTVSGESYIQYVPKDTDYFNYSATFWKKSKPQIFGVLARNLDDETKKRLQTNRGVIVKVVVRKTPAYNADILKNDIITMFEGEPVSDTEDFFEKINKHAGKQVKIKIIRDNKPRDITVTLRANLP